MRNTLTLSLILLLDCTNVFAGLEEANKAYRKHDYASALSEYRRLAEQGDALAQFDLGQTYREGQGVKQNYAEAVMWYQKSAEQGHTNAQYNLGLIYANGQGVKQDKAEAVKWYQKAAEQGDAIAQYNLGLVYKDGQGVKQNYAEAVKWFQNSADQGVADANSNLAFIYENGQGVLQDYVKAMRLYKQAVKAGDFKYATCSIGRIYRDGKLGQANPLMGYIYLNLAAKYGNPDAANERDEVKNSLSESDVLKARQVAEKWVEGADIAEIRSGVATLYNKKSM